MTTPDPKLVDASPTKKFFIEMLTRDVKLIDAIMDLVDNCVDGAKRLRPGGDYSHLRVIIKYDKDSFEIADTCGGIDIDVARTYAFRFGRPGEVAAAPGSIGEFGVGMKRSFFKLGNFFEVRSVTEKNSFSLEVDVKKWRNLPDWNFVFSDFSDSFLGDDTQGTKVRVTQLHQDVAERFALPGFNKDLHRALESRHIVSLQKGLEILINGIALTSHEITLPMGDDLQPAADEFSLDEEDESPLRVRIYAGIIDESGSSNSGWNVFCNGRLVLKADTTEHTGWGEEGVSEDKIPRWHPQYSRFRGYVLLDSEDSSKMPWNTTKSGIDFDSRNFRVIRGRMIELMRPVIDYLNKLKDEKSIYSSSGAGRPRIGPLEKSLKAAEPVKLTQLPASARFKYPRVTEEVPKDVNIVYTKPEAQVDAVKKALNVTSAREAGIRTFEYFYNLEIGDA